MNNSGNAGVDFEVSRIEAITKIVSQSKKRMDDAATRHRKLGDAVEDYGDRQRKKDKELVSLYKAYDVLKKKIKLHEDRVKQASTKELEHLEQTRREAYAEYERYRLEYDLICNKFRID